MRNFAFSLLICALTINLSTVAVQANTGSYPYTQVPFTAVQMVENSFWGERLKAAREVTVPLAFSKCESEGRYENFVKAARCDALASFKLGKASSGRLNVCPSLVVIQILSVSNHSFSIVAIIVLLFVVKFHPF